MSSATRKDFNMKIEVRKMTNDEIDNSDTQYWCDDDTCVIYREDELEFMEEQS